MRADNPSIAGSRVAPPAGEERTHRVTGLGHASLLVVRGGGEWPNLGSRGASSTLTLTQSHWVDQLAQRVDTPMSWK